MAVMLASARSDEHGKAKYGAAGDQTGREVMIQAWYPHEKEWFVLRAIDPAKRALIAQAAIAAAKNENIGYDQSERNDLYAVAKRFGFDPSKVDEKVETDCSALVRVACEFAGIHTDIAFTTSNLFKVLMATGAFVQMVGAQYEAQSDYLCAGDILCTKSKGHTVIVTTDGPKAEVAPIPYKLGDRILRKGDTGADVAELQVALDKLGYAPGKADGDFGPKTKTALLIFQSCAKLESDGEYGPKSHKALQAAMETLDKPRAYKVIVTGRGGAPLTQAQAMALQDEYQAAGYTAEIVEV